MDEKESILIVEDDESTCRSLALIFGKKGYETETAGTGREAIEKAQARFFNLALLDIRLPDMEGVELVAPLKEMRPDMAVIMVTGYASMETAVRALNEGASGYITKPLNMDEVLVKVGEVLERQRLVMENRRLYQEARRELFERKRAEEALRKSEASLAEAQRIAHLGNWDWDMEKDELLWSDEIYSIFGLAPQEFDATHEAFLSSVHPNDRELVKESVNKALYENKPYSIDHRILLPDGSERIVHEQAEVFFDETDRAIRMIGTVQDITERKQADEELQHTLEKLRKALGGIIQALALTVETRDPYTAGHQRRMTNLARAIATEMGLSEEQIDGIRMAGVVHDLGKISVPAGILNKPGRLTENEFAIIQTHPQIG